MAMRIMPALTALTVSSTARTHRPDGSFAPGNPWAARPGQCLNPKGRPFGSKARVVVERAETQIAKKYVARALDDTVADQGMMLRHALDKFVPDASLPSSLIGSGSTVINIVVVGDSLDAEARPEKMSR